MTMHGATFLSLKLDGELRSKARKTALRLWPAVVFVIVVFAIATYFYTDILTSLGFNPGVAPLAGIVAIVLSGFFMRRKMEGWSFVMTALTIGFSLVTMFLILFPRVMISTTDPAYSLTIYNASSSPYTLQVISIIALTLVPVVLVYQGYSYWVFRKRLTIDSKLEY